MTARGDEVGRPTRALVLAGGGVAGIAWELGVLQGIHDRVPALSSALLDADVIVGTSAGAVVAVQITSGVPLTELYAAQQRPDHGEIDIDLDWDALMTRFGVVADASVSVRDLRRRIGALGSMTHVERAARRRAITSRVPVPRWPDRPIRLAAVDVDAGELVAFDVDSGVGLVDAVAASCAVPGVWPPVVIDGRTYVDGGIPSGTNAHLAAGCDRILVITPTRPGQQMPFAALPEELDCVTRGHVMWMHADQASATAFGPNPLSPSTRAPAAEAGRALGRRHAEELAAFWG